MIISAPIIVLAWGVFSDDAQMMQKVELFFHHFGSLPIWFQTLWITVVASIFGIKGTQVFRNGGAKEEIDLHLSVSYTNNQTGKTLWLRNLKNY